MQVAGCRVTCETLFAVLLLSRLARLLLLIQNVETVSFIEPI